MCIRDRQGGQGQQQILVAQVAQLGQAGDSLTHRGLGDDRNSHHREQDHSCLLYTSLSSKGGGGRVDAKAVGQRIKAAREKKSMTQEDLAARINISPTHVSVIERGTKIPRIDTFVAIANVLEVSADELLVDVVNCADVYKRQPPGRSPVLRLHPCGIPGGTYS